MRGKIGILVGLAGGYVLGTRAGRERFEQIKDTAQNVWGNPKVQENLDKVKGFAAPKIDEISGKVLDGVKSAIGTVVSKTGASTADVEKITKSVKDGLGKGVDAAKNFGDAAKERVGGVIDNVSHIAKDAAKTVTDSTHNASATASKAAEATA